LLGRSRVSEKLVVFRWVNGLMFVFKCLRAINGFVVLCSKSGLGGCRPVPVLIDEIMN